MWRHDITGLRCAGAGASLPDGATTGYRRLCGRGFNEAVASRPDAQVNDRLMLRGTVDSEPDEDRRMPMVVIDGREISRDDLGRRVADAEGWPFKRELPDRSDEI